MPTSRSVAARLWRLPVRLGKTTQVDGKTFTGEEIESLTFAHFTEVWKIVREIELGIIKVSKHDFHLTYAITDNKDAIS